jgi:small subunit ribosomal protein S4e
MGHTKIQEAPKSWPISRKKSKFVVKPSSNLRKGISLLTTLREVLNLVQNRKEAKKIIQEKKVFVNGALAKDEKMGLSLFDVISIPQIKKDYKITILENGKFSAIETKEGSTKVSKVINKTKIKGNKIQLNLSDGMNIISDTKCKTNDSLVISLKGRKIEKCLELKEGKEAMVYAGKHIGETGVVKKIDIEKKLAILDMQGKEVNILISQLIITK